MASQGIQWDPRKWKKPIPGETQQGGKDATPRSGAKRSRSDGSTPPSLETIRKRTKNTEAKPEEATASGTLRPSYREAITSFKMAIVPKEFPKENFTEVQLEKNPRISSRGL